LVHGDSWRAIFASTAEMSFTLSEEHVAVGGTLGWVTCTENILSEVQGRVSVTAILATNIFERGPDGWLMVHHHGSHILGNPAEA
jgi:ketosteroid isomerase-like protein